MYIPCQTASDVDEPNNRSSRAEYDCTSTKSTQDRDLKIASLSFKNGFIQFIANGQSVSVRYWDIEIMRYFNTLRYWDISIPWDIEILRY